MKRALLAVGIVLVIFIAGITSAVETDKHMHLTRPKIQDNNTKTIKVNKNIVINQREYLITKVVVGDKYTVVNNKGDLITGMEIYQNGSELKYITASNSSSKGSAIGFEPANGTDGLEIRIYKIKSIQNVSYTFPVVFDGTTAIVDTIEQGFEGNIEIKVEGMEVSVTINGELVDYLSPKVNIFPATPGNHILRKDGHEIQMKEDGSGYQLPDEIYVYGKIIELDDQQIILPIS